MKEYYHKTDYMRIFNDNIFLFKKDYIMKNIQFFQLQAKNLFCDYKLDFMQDDKNYICAPHFLDINAVISAFDIDVNDFSLMKA